MRPASDNEIETESGLVVTPHDTEHPARVVWALAWPAVALNSMQVINVLLDRGFIGQLEASALTAQGGSTNVMFLMFSIAMAIGTAATALVSRAYGAGQVSEFRAANRQTLALTIWLGILFALLGMAAAGPSARALLPANDTRAIELMTQFLTVYAIGMPAIYVIQTLAGSLRGIGDTKSPMVISGIQIGLHILFNFIFIFPPRSTSIGITIPGLNLGLNGAAWALSLSAWCAAAGYMFYVARTPLGTIAGFGLPDLGWAKRILRIATPAATMSVLRVASLAAFTLVLKTVPNASAAIAAMSIAFAIEAIMFMPAFGLSMAAAALVGQSLGMNRPDRAERLAWTAGHHGALVVALVAIPIFFGASGIAHFLVDGKEAIVTEATNLIRWLCITEVLFAYAMVMIGGMQGAGDTVRPMWITIVCMWLLRVPLSWALAIPFGLGATGAWIAMSGTQAVQGFMAIALFKQGRWKHQKV
ncbi:MAG: putative FMN/FAD exporter YeeO [Fimbriimonadaceae bacterium]|nr:putative FMN/FAD exporter YeeO [Fimbriimonadaceae bacterium]